MIMTGACVTASGVKKRKYPTASKAVLNILGSMIGMIKSSRTSVLMMQALQSELKTNPKMADIFGLES